VAAERNKQGDSHYGSDGSSSDDPRLVYRPHPGTTPKVEARTLAAVYRYVIRCYEQKKMAADVGEGEDGTEDRHAGGPSEERPNKDGSA
jgi:hypothetical protein